MLPGVDAKLQLDFLHHHPLRGAFILISDAIIEAPHLIVKALYTLAWNDIYPPTAVYYTLILSLAGFCLVSTWQAITTWRARGMLVACVLSSILALSLAEYLIWTKVGSPRVSGLIARYYLPFVPFLLLFTSQKLRSFQVAARTGWILCASAFLFLFILLTPPWLLSHRFYNTGPIVVLKATLK